MKFARVKRIAKGWIWEGNKVVGLFDNYEFSGEKSVAEAQAELNKSNPDKEYQIMSYDEEHVWIDIPADVANKNIAIEAYHNPEKKRYVNIRRLAQGFVWNKGGKIEQFFDLEIDPVQKLADVEKELNNADPDKLYTITSTKEVKTIIEITKEMERVYKYADERN